MRLDKFLKTSLIFKTRSSAEKAIKDGAVFLNDKQAKPSLTVAENDKITIKTLDKTTEYKILLLLDKNVSRQMAKEMYEIISETHHDF